MRSVRCPRCSHVNQASGTLITCKKCGLSGNVGAAKPGTPEAKDPWTITIDLRKANPGNWGAGSKALAVFLLLAVAFIGGGLTGVVLERAKGGVVSDLSGGLLTGSQAGDATGEVDAGTGEEAVDTGVDAEPDAEPDASSDPPPAAPPATEDCDNPTAYGCLFATYIGAEGDAPMPITVEHGLVGMYIDYAGESKFALKFTEPGSVRAVETVLTDFNGKGKANYQALRYVGLALGDYEVSVPTGTDGSWTVYLVYPTVSPEKLGHSDSGNGDGIVSPVAVGDTATVTVETPGGYGVRTHVKGWDAAGNQVCDNGFNGQDSGTVELQCAPKVGTQIFIDVRAPKSSDAQSKTWTVTVA